jgi:hypothetical protein
MIDWKSPWVLGSAGLLLILLVFFRGSGGSSAASSGVASQASANATNVELAGIQAQTDQANIAANSSLAVYQAGADASIIGQAFGWLANSDNNQTARGNTAAAVATNYNDNLTSTQLATISQATTFGSLERANSGALALQTEQDATTVRVNGDNNALMATLSPELATINANNNQALASISANTATTIAGQQANAAVATAQAQQQASQSNGMLGFLGNIFSGVTKAATSPAAGTPLGAIFGL